MSVLWCRYCQNRKFVWEFVQVGQLSNQIEFRIGLSFYSTEKLQAHTLAHSSRDFFTITTIRFLNKAFTAALSNIKPKHHRFRSFNRFELHWNITHRPVSITKIKIGETQNTECIFVLQQFYGKRSQLCSTHRSFLNIFKTHTFYGTFTFYKKIERFMHNSIIISYETRVFVHPNVCVRIRSWLCTFIEVNSSGQTLFILILLYIYSD